MKIAEPNHLLHHVALVSATDDILENYRAKQVPLVGDTIRTLVFGGDQLFYRVISRCQVMVRQSSDGSGEKWVLTVEQIVGED